VLAVVAQSIDCLMHSIDAPSTAFFEIRESVGKASAVAPEDGVSLQHFVSELGRYPVWVALLALAATEPDPVCLTLVGALYCTARATPACVPDGMMNALRQHCQREGIAGVVSASSEIAAMARRALEAARDQFDIHRLSRDTDRINAVSVAVAVRLQRLIYFPSGVCLRALAVGTALKDVEVAECSALLRAGMEESDVVCGLIALATWIGLPIHIFLAVSIRPVAGETVRVDLYAATVEIDFELALRELAKAKYPNTKPASDCLMRPIPMLIAVCMIEALERIPSARCFRDLLGRRTLHQRTPIPGCSAENKRQFTAAKVIASRSRLMIDARMNLEAVAYAALDLGRISKSESHYMHLTREELWCACATRSALHNWGEVQALIPGPGIGSRVTPTDSLIQATYLHFSKEIDARHPGRHANAAKLIKHHNTYTAAVAWLLCLLLALRECTRYQLLASMVRHPETDAIPNYRDKRSTPKPTPPLACCPEARECMRLYLASCRALKQRLPRTSNFADHPHSAQILAHIEAIERGEPVYLLFTITDAGVVPAGTTVWRDALPRATPMAEDFGRHSWPDWMRGAKLSAADSEAFLRHVAERRELIVSTGGRGIAEWLGRIFSVQQAVVERLRIRAFKGLAQK
jgi:hypothetical protein